METRRYNERKANREVYFPDQVESVLRGIGVDIQSDTFVVFTGYCPFHNNTDSTAFAVNKTDGSYICFNPSCGVYGSLMDLVQKLTNKNYYEAYRFINKFKSGELSVSEQLAKATEKKPEFVPFPVEPVERLSADLWTPQGQRGLDYLHGRGFNDDTLKYFEVGYSAKQDMTTVPMHDPSGMLVGFIGRSVEGKEFKNTRNLPKSLTAWNYHRAKVHDTVIIVEASFDAMRVHQAGYENVVALLGGSLSDAHVTQLGRTFSTIIIMSDFDQKKYRPNCRACDYKECVGHRPGRELGWQIARHLSHRTIKWAAYDDTCVYPHDAKDVGNMSDVEIRQCIKNAVSHFEYSRWGIDD